MPTGTANLNAPYVVQSQAGKEVTINDASDTFDSGIAGLLEKVCTAGGTITLSTAEWANMVLHLTGSPGAGFNVVVPTNKKLYIVDNASGQTATVKTPSGTGIAVSTATVKILRCDGTNVVTVI